MNQRREFDIAFVGLKPGIHVYEYRLEDKFFADYGEQDFSNAAADVKLSLDKHNGFMQLKFDIGGTVDVLCDRCGNALTKQLWDEFNIVVKMVDDPEEMNNQEEDPDVYYIARSESHLHIADWLYEFVNLCLPMQKLCGQDESGTSLCNQEVIDKLRKMEDEVQQAAKPIWKGLEKFKDLDN